MYYWLSLTVHLLLVLVVSVLSVFIYKYYKRKPKVSSKSVRNDSSASEEPKADEYIKIPTADPSELK